MSGHDLTSGVAVRLAAGCLTASGRLRSFDLWDIAVRGALLVDLALAGRVVQEADSVIVDPAPTGFAPADALLQPMAVEPERDLDWWMDHGAVGLADVVRANVRSGRWRRRWTPLGRRYAPADPVAPAADVVPGDPGTAALHALADCSGIADGLPGGPAAALVERTGEVRWLCSAVVEHLQLAHRRMLVQAAAARGGSSHP